MKSVDMWSVLNAECPFKGLHGEAFKFVLCRSVMHFIRRKSSDQWEKISSEDWKILAVSLFSFSLVEVSNIILPHIAVPWWDGSVQKQSNGAK